MKDFIQDSEGALYAGGNWGYFGRVLKSSDAGMTWVEMVRFPGSYWVECLLQSLDGTIYAGTDRQGPDSVLFRSVDAGTTWVQSGDLDEASCVLDLLQARDGTIYAATYCDPYTGEVFKWHPPQGDLVSSVYDAGPNLEYGLMSWDETLNGQSLVMKVRTDTLSDMSTAPDWHSCLPAVNGDDISSLSSVQDGEPYIQYRVEMVSSSLDSTAVLHEVRIQYTVTGIEEANHQLAMTNVKLMQNVPNPLSGTTDIRYQISSADGGRPTAVTLKVYGLSGRVVKALVDREQGAGYYSVRWDRKDDAERMVAPGVYFYRLTTGSFRATRKMVVLR